jgi:hypothetical protein
MSSRTSKPPLPTTDPTRGRSAGSVENALQDPVRGRSAGTPLNAEMDPTRSHAHPRAPADRTGEAQPPADAARSRP